MKKILTLMAAMSAVAGPAMADDYVWNVDATGNITAEVKGDIAFANNKFTFTVNSGEKVWVKGSNVTVSFGGVNLTGKEVTFDMEGAGLLYTPGATGQVTVTLGANSTIEKIKVVGESSMKIEGLFEAVKAQVQKANQETAVWATESDLEPFFTAVRAQINKQGAINQQVRALLENYQANNSVNEHAAELKIRLNAAIHKIKKYVVLAKEDKETYDRIIGDDAKGLKEVLEKGTSTPKNSEVDNNSEEYIKDWKKSSEKTSDSDKLATFDKWKTAWAEEAWNSFYTDKELLSIEAIKNEALAELGKFANVELPDVASGSFQTGFTEADFKAKYAKLQTEAKNVVNRAIFERDYADKIKAAMEDIQAINEVVKAGTPFSVQTPSFSRLTDEVTQLDRLLAQPTDAHRSLTKEDLNGADFKGSYDERAKEIADIKAALVKQAKDALKARIEPTQKSLNETSYKISAKYVNEKDTQKKWELEFAKIQKQLDDLKKNVAGVADFKDIVNTYNTYNGEFDTINKDIDSKWQETLSEQKQEVLRNNHNEAVTLLGKVEKVREDYNTNVLRINKWVDATWTDNDTKVKLNANLKELFSVAGGVDKMKEDIVADTLRYTKLINETPDVEFNANDNQYRLLSGEVGEFTKNLETVEKAIMAQIEWAVFTANLRAANYLNDVPKSIADSYVKNAQDASKDKNLWPGNKYELMTEKAVGLFQKEFGKIAHKDNNQGAGYLDEAKKIIDDGHVTDKANVDIDKQKLADQVADVEAIFAKVKPAVDSLNLVKEDYKKLYGAIYAQKIEWNVVKAETAKYQKAIDDAAKTYGTTGFDVTARLKELNMLFDGVKDEDGCTEDGASTTLEKDTNPVNASNAELQASINKKIEDFKAGLNEICHYPDILKNNAAMTTADADIKAVEAELVNAREAIKAYNETVQAGATQLLNGAESALKTAKAAIEDASNKLTLADNYTEGQNLKQGLTNASQEIKDALAWAAQAAKEADLDYNGDGKVDVKDLLDADAEFQKTGDGFTFYKFFDAYLESLSK